jgi:glycosyltransferase involved in cell wall biosynthesis
MKRVREEQSDRRIVAFTKDWNDVPTCTTHILRMMARQLPVLWVSSIGTRKPRIGSGKDWRRLVGRIAALRRKAEWKENRLHVLRPILIPKADRPLSRWINRVLFCGYLRRELPSGFSGVIEYWCFVPNAVDLLPPPSPGNRVIYYCADDWTTFHNLDGEWLARKERELVRRADVVFATARLLEEKLNSMTEGGGASVIYMPHGVDHAQFARACDKSLPVPPDIAAIAKPVIGFYGNLHTWIDFRLIAALAQARPQWSFVLIGEIYGDAGGLGAITNVHLLGRREHARLPDYCRGFDVAMIPYDLAQPRMASVNPVKTKELLAAGVPIVAARIPELADYGDAVLLADGVDAWLAALERQMRRPVADRLALSQRVQTEDWTAKVATIRSALA